MQDIIVYLLKANLSIILFYLGYRLLLRKLTFYNLNRFYLLFAVLFSTVYPFLDIKNWFAKREAIPAEITYIMPDWQQLPVEEFSLWPIVGVLFWLGVAYFAVRLLIRLGSLWNIHRGSHPATWKLYHYRQVFRNVLPFSFWRNIYINVHNHGEGELGEIFEHEQIHVNELHTLDIVLAELFSVFCWFNPGVWLMRHAVHENLEFITDRRVLQRGVDKKAYQYSLLSVGKYTAGNPAIVNNFNVKSLKRRIMMMNKQRSSTLQLGKYLFAVPVIAAFVLVFTVSKAYQHGEEGNTEEQLTEQPVQLNEVILGEVMEEEPVVEAIQPVSQPDTIVDKADPSKPAKEALKRLSADKVNTIVLRGVSAADREPLYILDGEQLVLRDGLSAVDPNTIESISILKDASATALYGPKGVNGVILITTKKETADKQLEAVTVEGRPLHQRDSLTSIRVIGYGHKTDMNNSDSISESVSRVVLRGSNDDFNGALIIIDGEEKRSSAFKKLSPSDIEAINVLKDISATDKYGEKGAKGVIEVTTKK